MKPFPFFAGMVQALFMSCLVSGSAAEVFISLDIGSPAIAGSVTNVSNGYDIVAGGRDIGGASDQFQFNYQSWMGDFDFKVRVAGLALSDAWAKAGLMARESLSTNSRYAATFTTPSISGSFFQFRLTNGGSSTVNGSFPVTYPNTWLRLRRSNDTFTGYASLDGDRWTQLGSTTLVMSNEISVGFAVASRNNSQPTTAQFREFQDVTGGSVGSISLPKEPLGACSRKTGLVISEIMYHPRAIPGSTASLEFIELFNSQSIFENIGGYRLSGAIDFTFPTNTIMPAGSFLVVAREPAPLQSRYGISGVQGPWIGAATNGLPGDAGTVRLRNRAGAVLLEVKYEGGNPWPIAADGAGHSLVLARPSYGEGDAAAWAASDTIGGSPGQQEPFGADPMNSVVINEFLANSDGPLQDFIELYNHSNQEVNLGGAWLTDRADANKFRIPNGVTLPSRGFVSFTQTTLGFSLSAGGERIYLVNSNQTRVIDAIDFEAQASSISSGRFPNGAPNFSPLASRTPGATNNGPLWSDVVINEIMYNPISGEDADEFIELYNRGTNAVNVGGWKFTSGISFILPDNTVIPPDRYLVVAKDADRLWTNHATLNSTNTVGNYSGALANGGERVALAQAEHILTTNGNVVTTNTAYIVVNEVTYGDGGRWGAWSDGGGSSLELKDARSDNRLSANWADSDETAKSTWTNVEFTGALGENLHSPVNDNLHVYLLGIGECLIDDVEVRNLSNTNVNLLGSSGTFESAPSGWTPQGSHDQSTIEAGGYNGAQCLHLRAASRGDPGANKVRSLRLSPFAAAAATLRAKARWLRGFPEILLRLHGGSLEAPGRLAVPANLGTPGARNSRALANAGPAIFDVEHAPVLPAAGEPVVVTACVHDPDGLSSLAVRYRLDPSSVLMTVNMKDDGTEGDTIAGDGIHSGTIPGQNAGALVAFYIEAVDPLNVTNLFPQDVFPQAPLSRAFPNDSPSRECLVRFGERQMMGSFATYHLWITSGTSNRWHTRDNLNNAALDGTFVYNNYRVAYNTRTLFAGSPFHRGQMTTGPAGVNRNDYVLNLPSDDRCLGATDFVLNTPGNPSGSTSTDLSAQAEQASYVIFKEIDVHYNHRRYIHFFLNGIHRSITTDRPGNFIMEDSQQPNGDVVEEWYSDDPDGELYKIEDWFEFDDNATAFTNNDADLTRRTTTLNGVTRLNLAPYRFMWRKRAVGPGESASDYTNFFALLNAVSPTASQSAPVDATQFEIQANVEQWMRIFAVQRTVGNWDSYGWERGKNAYTYKGKNGRFEMMTWDIDFTMGVGSRGTGEGLFSSNDPRVVAMFNTPAILRAYWRAFQDIVNGPLNSAFLNPILDAKAAAFTANGVNSNPSSVTTIKNYVTGRRNYLVGQLNTVTTNFFTKGTNFLTASSNLVILTGIAPIEVKDITLNGLAYPVTWSFTASRVPTTWTIRLVVPPGTNVFVVQGYDRFGQALSGTQATNIVVYTGPEPEPQGSVGINEIMYHPLVPEASFVEIYNSSTNYSFDLSGWRLEGLGFKFPTGTVLGSRQLLVVAKNRGVFGSTYGATIPVVGEFAGELDGAGETLTLIRPGPTPESDLVVDRVRYEQGAPWPAEVDGTGRSLQLIDPSVDHSRVGNWSDGRVGWQFFSFTGSANGSRLFLWLDGAGDVYVDDLLLVAGSVPGAGPNLLFNGDFESELSGPWIIPPLATNSAISSAVAHSGQRSLHLVFNGVGGTTTTSVSQDAMPLVTNDTYTMSFWYLPGNAGNTLTLRWSTLFRTTLSIKPLLSTAGSNNTATASLPAFPPLWLNEVQAQNLSGAVDGLGEREPWVELYNAGSNSVSLDGLYLANQYSNLIQWAFPAGRMIGPGQFLVVWADGEPGETTAAELHTSFRLNSSSGSVALGRLVNGEPQVVDYLNYTGLGPDQSYGDFPDGQPFERRVFYVPTPATTNYAPPITVFINEWMADNGSYLADPVDGDFEDWFELYNPTAQAVDLSNYYLTDNLTNKTQWRIPTGTILPAKGYRLVWADGETNQNGGADLHANFQLSRNGEAIGLFAPDGTLIDAVTFLNQTNNTSQGRWPDGAGQFYFFSGPSPNGTNASPSASNQSPVLSAISDRGIGPEQRLLITNQASDLDGDQLSFSLGPGAPAGAKLDATNGIFSWRAKRSQAPSTNLIMIMVSDDGTPSLSATQTFSVIVGHYLELSVGTNILRTGQSGSVPMQLYCTAGLTNLEFALETPSDHLTNWALGALAPAVNAATLSVSPTQMMIRLSATAGQSLQGTQQLGQLSFLAQSNRPSAFVPLAIADLAARSASENVTNFFPQHGRVVVIGEEPLLEANRPTGMGGRTLTVFGKPGTNYVVEQATNWMGANSWTRAFEMMPLEGLFKVHGELAPTNHPIFYRAYQK